MDDASLPRAKKINAMKARQAFGQILEEVFYRGEQFIIERAGKPMAALIPLSLLEELTSTAKMEHDTIKESKRRSRKKKS